MYQPRIHWGIKKIIFSNAFLLKTYKDINLRSWGTFSVSIKFSSIVFYSYLCIFLLSRILQIRSFSIYSGYFAASKTFHFVRQYVVVIFYILGRALHITSHYSFIYTFVFVVRRHPWVTSRVSRSAECAIVWQGLFRYF